jgi:hypothetical protein
MYNYQLRLIILFTNNVQLLYRMFLRKRVGYNEGTVVFKQIAIYICILCNDTHKRVGLNPEGVHVVWIIV